MSEYAWEPVGDGEIKMPYDDVILYPGDDSLTIDHELCTITVALPDDLRLCRRVPAARGVPVEVREAMERMLAHFEAVTWNLEDLAGDDAITVRAWLDAQQPEQDHMMREMAQGVPVEAIRTLREYGIPLGMTYANWHKACQVVQNWLDAQPQPGQEE